MGEKKMGVDLNQFICFNFYNGWREITSFYKDSLGMDVTPQKVYVLILLDMRNKITMNDLSHGMNLDSSAVSTLISRMEKNSLVKRTHGTQDRRTVFVQLTKQGDELKKELLMKTDQLTDNISENITADDLAKLQEIVGKITNNHKKLLDAA